MNVMIYNHFENIVLSHLLIQVNFPKIILNMPYCKMKERKEIKRGFSLSLKLLSNLYYFSEWAYCFKNVVQLFVMSIIADRTSDNFGRFNSGWHHPKKEKI